MGLTSWMKMTRFQTFWIQMRKNKPLDESRETSQTLRTKMAFESKLNFSSFTNNIKPRTIITLYPHLNRQLEQQSYVAIEACR
ncbi:hypothetical protein Hanom_Chr16g01495891 [Helianthus anomalus]